MASCGLSSIAGADGSSFADGNGCDRLLLLDQSFCIVRAKVVLPISSITLLHADKTDAYRFSDSADTKDKNGNAIFIFAPPLSLGFGSAKHRHSL